MPTFDDYSDASFSSGGTDQGMVVPPRYPNIDPGIVITDQNWRGPGASDLGTPAPQGVPTFQETFEETQGRLPGGLDHLSSSIDRQAYRLRQQAMTNPLYRIGNQFSDTPPDPRRIGWVMPIDGPAYTPANVSFVPVQEEQARALEARRPMKPDGTPLSDIDLYQGRMQIYGKMSQFVDGKLDFNNFFNNPYWDEIKGQYPSLSNEGLSALKKSTFAIVSPMIKRDMQTRQFVDEANDTFKDPMVQQLWSSLDAEKQQRFQDPRSLGSAFNKNLLAGLQDRAQTLQDPDNLDLWNKAKTAADPSNPNPDLDLKSLWNNLRLAPSGASFNSYLTKYQSRMERDVESRDDIKSKSSVLLTGLPGDAPKQFLDAINGYIDQAKPSEMRGVYENLIAKAKSTPAQNPDGTINVTLFIHGKPVDGTVPSLFAANEEMKMTDAIEKLHEGPFGYAYNEITIGPHGAMTPETRDKHLETWTNHNFGSVKSRMPGAKIGTVGPWVELGSDMFQDEKGNPAIPQGAVLHGDNYIIPRKILADNGVTQDQIEGQDKITIPNVIKATQAKDPGMPEITAKQWMDAKEGNRLAASQNLFQTMQTMATIQQAKNQDLTKNLPDLKNIQQDSTVKAFAGEFFKSAAVNTWSGAKGFAGEISKFPLLGAAAFAGIANSMGDLASAAVNKWQGNDQAAADDWTKAFGSEENEINIRNFANQTDDLIQYDDQGLDNDNRFSYIKKLLDTQGMTQDQKILHGIGRIGASFYIAGKQLEAMSLAQEGVSAAMGLSQLPEITTSIAGMVSELRGISQAAGATPEAIALASKLYKAASIADMGIKNIALSILNGDTKPLDLAGAGVGGVLFGAAGQIGKAGALPSLARQEGRILPTYQAFIRPSVGREVAGAAAIATSTGVDFGLKAIEDHYNKNKTPEDWKQSIKDPTWWGNKMALFAATVLGGGRELPVDHDPAIEPSKNNTIPPQPNAVDVGGIPVSNVHMATQKAIIETLQAHPDNAEMKSLLTPLLGEPNPNLPKDMQAKETTIADVINKAMEKGHESVTDEELKASGLSRQDVQFASEFRGTYGDAVDKTYAKATSVLMRYGVPQPIAETIMEHIKNLVPDATLNELRDQGLELFRSLGGITKNDRIDLKAQDLIDQGWSPEDANNFVNQDRDAFNKKVDDAAAAFDLPKTLDQYRGKGNPGLDKFLDWLDQKRGIRESVPKPEKLSPEESIHQENVAKDNSAHDEIDRLKADPTTKDC